MATKTVNYLVLDTETATLPFVNAMKGNQNVVNAATSIVNAVSSLTGMLKKGEMKQRRKKSR